MVRGQPGRCVHIGLRGTLYPLSPLPPFEPGRRCWLRFDSSSISCIAPLSSHTTTARPCSLAGPRSRDHGRRRRVVSVRRSRSRLAEDPDRRTSQTVGICVPPFRLEARVCREGLNHHSRLQRRSLPTGNSGLGPSRCGPSVRAGDEGYVVRVDVIVVDNDSTDETAAVVRNECSRVVHEPVQGIAQARNIGWPAMPPETCWCSLIRTWPCRPRPPRDPRDNERHLLRRHRRGCRLPAPRQLAARFYLRT